MAASLQANQRRFDAAGWPPLRVEADELDWESPVEVEAVDLVVGSDLIYLHELHAPLVQLLRAYALCGARAFLSWEVRKPAEEANFLRIATAAGLTPRLLGEEVREGTVAAWDLGAVAGDRRILAYEFVLDRAGAP